MDRVFRFLVTEVGISLPDAARLCATTPCAELGRRGAGQLVKGALADLVVMNRRFTVTHTYVNGRLRYSHS
jgi:N-acetylglucosamine-6-phosphate deacetylase